MNVIQITVIANIKESIRFETEHIIQNANIFPQKVCIMFTELKM